MQDLKHFGHHWDHVRGIFYECPTLSRLDYTFHFVEILAGGYGA